MKKLLVCLILLFALIPIAVYAVFISEGFLPVGKDLDKSNWLAFTIGYIGFVGTVSLSYIAVWQNDRFKRENDKAQEKLMQINDRLLSIEEDRNKAAIAIPSTKMFVYPASSTRAETPYSETKSTMVVLSDSKKIDGIYYLDIPYYLASSISASSIQITNLKIGFYSHESQKLINGYHIQNCKIASLPLSSDNDMRFIIISFEDRNNLVQTFMNRQTYIYLELELNVFSYLNTVNKQSFKFSLFKPSKQRLKEVFNDLHDDESESICVAFCKQNISTELYKEMMEAYSIKENVTDLVQ